MGGYLCVVEDERGFDRHFARRLLGGMLDLDERVMGQLQYDDAARVAKKAATFRKLFAAFDFTRVLESGE